MDMIQTQKSQTNRMPVELLITHLKKNLLASDALLLFGPMGSGKTYFTKLLCEQFGTRASSPTYTLVNNYSTIQRLSILHSDLYRLPSLDWHTFHEIFSISSLSIVEWAERIPETLLSLLENRIHVHFDDQQGFVNVDGYGRFEKFFPT